ncbi:MAG: HAMP domain-containing histidine kinase [Clostridia bacterium]|nr:HAMP domain-containing histidine kinase [Clostridia bacterium]
MNFELKFKSIATRWFFSIFLAVAAVVLVFAVAFSASYSSIYVERMESLAGEYTHEFSALESCGFSDFADTAVAMSESFEHKDRLEVQLFDRDGRMIVSTAGFEVRGEKMPDYQASLSNANHRATYKGKNSAGEEILAGTVGIYNEGGSYLGAYRWVTSMKAANRHIMVVIGLMMLLFVAILAISAVSGIYFIKSIVLPIRDVSNAARKIAAGDFNAKIEIKKNDEIGELCDTINYMASELAAADTMKNDFISSVSHELRTPLTAIRGWGETAKMSIGYDDALVTRGLDVVLSESDRLSGLVEDLLDFSRMQNGKLTVNEPQPLDISELLSSAAGMYTELARQQGIEVSYTPPSEPSIVMGDRDRLKQVFINIIDNAVKYSEKGGLVLVVQSREEGFVHVQVKDTGVGIPAEEIDRVKEKFFKSNKTVRGSGIGLAVADEIIKQHNGLLVIESTEGVGTTVTVVLPAYEEEEAIQTEQLPAVENEAEPLQTLPEVTENEEDKENLQNG